MCMFCVCVCMCVACSCQWLSKISMKGCKNKKRGPVKWMRKENQAKTKQRLMDADVGDKRIFSGREFHV